MAMWRTGGGGVEEARCREERERDSELCSVYIRIKVIKCQKMTDPSFQCSPRSPITSLIFLQYPPRPPSPLSSTAVYTRKVLPNASTD